MQSVKVESPRVKHYDAIHHTNLLNGVKVNVGKLAEDGWEVINTKTDENRYHIRTICHRIADEFFMHKGEADYVPFDFQMRPILSIELDSDFRAHALYEFAAKKITEQLPPLLDPRDKLVGSLTDRLIEAYESSGMEAVSHCSLDLSRMREIRDQVFSGEKRGEERKSSPSRTVYPIVYDGSFQAGRRREEDSEGCCSPTVIAGAGILSSFFVLVALGSKLFSDDNEKGQRVTRVNKLCLNTQMNSRGTIY